MLPTHSPYDFAAGFGRGTPQQFSTCWCQSETGFDALKLGYTSLL